MVRVRSTTVIIAVFVVVAFLIGNVTARTVAKDTRSFRSKALLNDDDGPAYCIAFHDVGSMRLAISNSGVQGWSWGDGCFETINPDDFHGCEFPKNSNLEHLYSLTPWIGAVVGQDTLVSTGHNAWSWFGREFAPDIAPYGNIVHRSIIDPDAPEYEGALSEQDFIAVYYDTLDSLHNTYVSGGELSKPIGIEITQSSYAWSYGYAEDFVLFDLTIRNMDWKPLKDVYIGLYVDSDVGLGGIDGYPAAGDVSGFLHTYPSHQGCGFVDILNLAWTADADGDPFNGEWLYRPTMVFDTALNPPGNRIAKSVFSAAGTVILNPPGAAWDLSFNWWVPVSLNGQPFGFGPQRRSNYRIFEHGSLGGPEYDRERYYLLSNEDFDYDQVFTGRISQVDQTWLYPVQEIAGTVARGLDTRYLLSYGPFQVGGYQSLPIAFALVIGDNFHSNPLNIDNLPDHPYTYYDNLDFSDLALNAVWAQWVYDNPGFDTDGDGYFGEFRVCVHESTETDSGWVITEADTHWYRGDGIPDFRGAGPPPAPYFWVTSLVDGLHVRFNGQRSETERDIFLGVSDFEGYRVYLGRDNRRASFSLVASYDREDYDKYVWDNNRLDEYSQPEPGFELFDTPFTLEDLRCLYGQGADPCNDSSFHPLSYPISRPYFHPDYGDSVFYFHPHDYNAFKLDVNTPIRKRYPDTPDPRGITIEELTDDHYTEDGYLKFFEYEFTIENLLPTVPYWVNVTAFDFGSPAGGIEALETPVTQRPIEAYPFNSEAEATGVSDEVYVYPNPYIIEDNYRARGFELRTRTDLPDYRVHTIHFSNLPPRCTIRIHSPDGDLVREIRHDFDPSDPAGRDHEWHLVSQNRQLVVTGWYYWTVETPDGRVQMGKLAIIM